MTDTFGWQHTGKARPSFAETPKPGQESVWDYPRPPALVDEPRLAVIKAGNDELARSNRALSLKETASPPTIYIPSEDVHFERLITVSGHSYCEWKGKATYYALKDQPDRAVAWSYPKPNTTYLALKDHVCFYPSRVDCWLGNERVRAQKSEFYGGWITDEIVGPFKGEPGTGGW